ncbi:MAG: two-component sensor histidine kinase [Deltaproteobacteria bacterium]|nr:two-component sensor histidine kinase [Deltaproteobacteria bacterium]
MTPFTKPLIVAFAALVLVALGGFIVVRLLRSRSSGLSIRMQIFIALASIVGMFAFVLGVLVLDRIKARADLVGGEAALGEARTVAALVGIEMETSGRSLEDVSRNVAGSPRLARSDEEGGPHLALVDSGGRVVLQVGRSPEEPGTVSATAPIEVRGTLVGHARVVKPTLLIRKTLADFAPTVLVLSTILVAVAALAAAAIGGRIASPIEALTAFAERVSQGERGAPPPRGAGREVIQLSRSLDSMRRELQGGRFVETFAADLSHELKNPVAAIRASAEVLDDGALEEPEEARRFVARILESTGRIEALLGDLLSLARLEARGVEAEAAVDLAAIVREALGPLGEPNDAGELEVVIEDSASMCVRGDAGWLARAIRNLIDNARLHGDKGAPVMIRLSRRDDRVLCRVSNRGAVAPAVAARLFRRFVTTRADRGGTGLGLAIVRAVAEAHGGTAQCVRGGPPEVAFEFDLPGAK